MVLIQVGETPAPTAQVCAGTLVVVTAAGQVVVTQPLPAVAEEVTQVPGIGTLVVVTGAGQLIVIQFGEVPAEGVHDDAGWLV